MKFFYYSIISLLFLCLGHAGEDLEVSDKVNAYETKDLILGLTTRKNNLIIKLNPK